MRDEFERVHIMWAWLKDFEIGEPIKSWINPRIEVTSCGVMITCKTLNSLPPHGPFTFTFNQMMPSPVKDKKQFYEVVRRALHAVLVHEADEAIRVEGADIYNPHTTDSPATICYCRTLR